MSTSQPFPRPGTQRSRRSRAAGFTLVELLVVIGIIALLMSILMPALSRARVQASTVQCAARMRQLTQAAMMYAVEFKGSLPPIAVTHGAFPNGHWGRPTIFSAGGEGYLTKYLAPTANPNMTGTTTGKLYACPNFEADIGESYTSAFTYRYNAILGGQDKPRLVAKYGTANWVPAVPWKLSQVKDGSNVALFAEGDSVQGALSQGAMGLVTEPAVDKATGQFGHNPRYGIHMHGKKQAGTYVGWSNSINPVWQGSTNIGYCDGSVRTLQWRIDSYPAPVFQDTWINPAMANVKSWAVNEW